ISERQIYYGMSMANDGNLIQVVPVSKKLENPLVHIDWESVLRIPEGAMVFVVGMWYRDLLPFLLERKVRGVFLETQYDGIQYKKEYERLVEAKWNFIMLDRLSAMEQAIEYLYNLKRRRIAVVKRYKNEPLHPYRQGMISGYERCGMVYDDKLYHEIEPNLSPLELENEIVDLWKRTEFDALIGGLVKPVYKALTEKLQLRLPDDVALMSFSDIPSYLDFPVPVTAIAFPNVNVGRETVKILNHRKPVPEKSIFQATIIERESTRKGAGAYVNHAFLPEISINPNYIIN
ncbi:MAG: substrate-binding domain-containing protein, partial [Victivallaceae bacterium]|nr:substrate-binding domain-containing protein [Victivallaceae bacterium]